ncbi:hypothetical protein REPUB_Repub20aG0036400 [Reevesia pubescens]
MSKRISNSESEEGESEEKVSEEEVEEENPKQNQQGTAENRARTEALGLSKMASSSMGSSPNSSRNSSKLKGKRKVVENDEDYRPNDEDDNDDDDDNDNDDDEHLPGKKTLESRKNKMGTALFFEVKNKGTKPPVQKHLTSSDYVDDDDKLMKLDPSISSSIPIPIPSEQAINNMDRDLFEAAETGDMEPFDNYKGDLLRLVDGRQNTALHIYSRTGGHRQVVNKKDEHKHSANFLHQLVEKCPSLLMQSNANREIPLHIAARHGHSDVVEFLIERTKLLQGEDLEQGLEATRMREMLTRTDKEENTAFHSAAEYGHLNVLQLLIKEVDPDFAFSDNTRGETPLYIASLGGYHHLVKEILKNRKSVAYGGPHGRTALHAAVMADDEETVTLLIERNKDLTKGTDENGRTPLHYAAHWIHRPVAKLLLEKEASAACKTDKEGVSALHMAAWQGCRAIVEDILSYCPGCWEIVDKRGWNFLHFLVVTLYPIDLKRFLLGNVVKDIPIRILLDEKDVNGYTPLHVMTAGPASQRSGFSEAFDFLQDQHGFGRRAFNTDAPFSKKKEVATFPPT